jgi:hypothetical protein
MTKHIIISILSVLICMSTAAAQFDFRQNEPDGARYIGGPRLGSSQTQIYRAGIVLEPGAALESAVVTVPVPMEWKEQRIISVNEEKMSAGLASRIEYPIINGGAMEMRIQLGNVQPTRPLELVIEVELENYELLPPENTGQYIIPKRVPQELQRYINESPCIESKNIVFSRMYADITKNRRTDWDKVEALYSFVQNNVKYNNEAWKDEAKGALAVTKMPKGEWTADCKDMSCLFVALCRAGKIPARIVRVPGHCYAEFFLEMKQDNAPRNARPIGFWFPCQVAGTYSFGGIPEKRVILQKGDSFPDAEKPRANTLWLRESFLGISAPGVSSQPHRWVRNTEIK